MLADAGISLRDIVAWRRACVQRADRVLDEGDGVRLGEAVLVARLEDGHRGDIFRLVGAANRNGFDRIFQRLFDTDALLARAGGRLTAPTACLCVGTALRSRAAGCR